MNETENSESMENPCLCKTSIQSNVKPQLSATIIDIDKEVAIKDSHGHSHSNLHGHGHSHAGKHGHSHSHNYKSSREKLIMIIIKSMRKK